MFNSRSCFNSRPDGFGVLEIAATAAEAPARRFVPLTLTSLAGEVTGPLASLRLTQTFSLPDEHETAPIEALYRFPLPGDAAVTGVTVQFGDVEIQTTLKERLSAEAEYRNAKQEGRQAALLTRESPDVFTLAVAGIKAGQDVRVHTEYVQLARAEGERWSLRIPLTTAPRYVRSDEEGSRHSQGQPLAVLRDPGHRFGLDLTIRGAANITSKTHTLEISRAEGTDRVQLRDGTVVPDRDCVLTWQATKAPHEAAMQVWAHADPASGHAYFLALCVSPAVREGAQPVAREVILLVDHSGSMEGAKWDAADWAVERFLTKLSEQDAFALGVFHTTTHWLVPQPTAAAPQVVQAAVARFRGERESGGTELGVALEQAVSLSRAKNCPARHILIVTDAEVTDAGRILRLADAEFSRGDRRRISVLCIDSAPNAMLAAELAERGGGLSRFLTSDPAEDDVTTALDEVLTDWSAPSRVGLTLEVNATAVEAVGRSVSLRTPDVASAIDLGDPPAGRPVWVAGRVRLTNEPLVFRLRDHAGDVLADCCLEPQKNAIPGLKALFGAERLRRLEYLLNSAMVSDELTAELTRLGYDQPTGEQARIYAENQRTDEQKFVRDLLVRESLDSGLPSSETAFVATRSEAGQQVAASLVVANALPANWSDRLMGMSGGGGSSARLLSGGITKGGSARLSKRTVSFALDDDDCLASVDSSFDAKLARSFSMPSMAAAIPVQLAGSSELPVEIVLGQHAIGDGAVLFDSVRDAATHNFPPTGRLTSVTVDISVTQASVGQELKLLVFVGDMDQPRARVALADLLPKGSRRPLNLGWHPGQTVRLALADPEDRWLTGVPAMKILIGWNG